MGYTVYTNSDFDALVSVLLLQEELTIDEIIFVDPSQVNNNEVLHTRGTPAVAANIPAFAGITLWFDHHKSNLADSEVLPGSCEIAPSCARVIENYYQRNRFPELLQAADKIDTADFSAEDLLNPSSYDLVSLTISGNIHDTHEMEYNRYLLTLLPKTPQDILTDPQVAQRVTKYQEDLSHVSEYIQKHTKLVGTVAVVDLREAPTTWILDSSFKFLHYVAFPEATIAIRLYHPNLDKEHIRFQVGRSIVNPKPSKADVASILKPLGGGGHAAAGGCTITTKHLQETYETILLKLLEANNEDNEFSPYL